VWSNVRALNLLSNALFALSGIVVCAAGVYALVRSPAFPLRTIEVGERLEHVRRAQVVAALQNEVSGTFFTADLERLRSRFETIPWVRHAEVRRRWPDRLVVRVEEHMALARWGRREDARLVNVQGEPFSAESADELPVISGPVGSEREVARRLVQFRAQLEPLGMAPQQVLLSERLAWQLRLANGLVLQLGRESAKDSLGDRLSRFVEAYPRTVAKLDRPNLRVDLRYPNGFAVRVPGLDRINDGRTARPRA
jgi:cell division protein FtsQ